MREKKVMKIMKTKNEASKERERGRRREGGRGRREKKREVVVRGRQSGQREKSVQSVYAVSRAIDVIAATTKRWPRPQSITGEGCATRHRVHGQLCKSSCHLPPSRLLSRPCRPTASRMIAIRGRAILFLLSRRLVGRRRRWRREEPCATNP